MKIGLAGFTGSGKSTVFHWLTGVTPDPGRAQQGQSGNAKIPDERLDWLSTKFKPKKTTPASIDFIDTPGLLIDERRDNPRRLAILRDTGGLVVVLNGFSEGDVAAELRRFREELLFADLEIVTNRVAKLEDQSKKPKPAKEREADQQELSLLQRIVAVFEKGQSAATLGLKEDEEKAVRRSWRWSTSATPASEILCRPNYCNWRPKLWPQPRNWSWSWKSLAPKIARSSWAIWV